MTSTEIVHGIHIRDLAGWLVLSEALAALEDKYRVNGRQLSDTARDMQQKVAALTTAATAARRSATSSRNPQGNASTGAGEVVNVNQAAELIGISPQAVRKNCTKGRLDAGKAGGNSWLITRISVDRLAYQKENK